MAASSNVTKKKYVTQISNRPPAKRHFHIKKDNHKAGDNFDGTNA